MSQPDPFVQFKEKQRQVWAHFAPIDVFTTPTAAHLVRYAQVKPGAKLLDVGCGTGVVAVTAAVSGAQVTGLDLTPELLERAKENAKIAGVSVTFQQGDAEALPYPDGAFDVVVSQFGHMFAPRAEVAAAELLRVLRPGGTLAFATWPPEHFVGRFFALTSRFAPPPPPGFSPPPAWGDVSVVRQRLGDSVSDLRFERGIMRFHLLSLPHYVQVIEETVGPARALAQSGDAETLARYRKELVALAGEYFEDNTLRQDYLLTRAIKR
ncbi:MAG: class I SAM-dependent methyltransferase [Myxococcales bacterium]